MIGFESRLAQLSFSFFQKTRWPLRVQKTRWPLRVRAIVHEGSKMAAWGSKTTCPLRVRAIIHEGSKMAAPILPDPTLMHKLVLNQPPFYLINIRLSSKINVDFGRRVSLAQRTYRV